MWFFAVIIGPLSICSWLIVQIYLYTLLSRSLICHKFPLFFLNDCLKTIFNIFAVHILRISAISSSFGRCHTWIWSLLSHIQHKAKKIWSICLLFSFPLLVVKHGLCSNCLSSKALTVTEETNDFVIYSNILGERSGESGKMTERVREVRSGTCKTQRR